MASVTLKHLGKNYTTAAAAAVTDLSLDIREGEFIALLGPSGCGKSTTLRMIAGLETPTAGNILFGDKDVTYELPADRNIAMVFQNYALYPHMTVRENLEYPLKKRRVPVAERQARSREVSELLQITALLDRRPGQLSGGQQQRVALGRALIRSPSVFLLDEPLSNLDAKLRSHMRTELVQLHRRLRTTMIYVTHDQLEAMTMADRIAIMFDGKLQQFDTPEQIYNKPCNREVAGFIGTPMMNFLAGSVQPGANGPELIVAGHLAAMLPAQLNSLCGRTVTVGVRPEDVTETATGIAAQVVLTEPIGHETLVSLDLGPHRVVMRHRPDFRIGAGEYMQLHFNPQKVHLFDPDTGQRVDTGT